MIAAVFLIGADVCMSTPAPLAHRVTRVISRLHASETDIERSPLAIDNAPLELSAPEVKKVEVKEAEAPIARPSAEKAALPQVGVALLLLAGIVTAILLRRRQRFAPQAIEIVAQQTLSNKHKLTMVRVGGQQILLGVSEAGVRLICNVADTADFSSTLAQVETTTASAPAPVASETEGIIRLREARERRAHRESA